MKLIKKYFDNKVILLKHDLHRDNRGYFVETYNKKAILKFGIVKNFVQDNQSYSIKKYTFRGIHIQLKPFAQAKLIKVTNGSIIDYVIDLRLNSKTFGKNIQINMQENDNKLLYIPEGFGHAFLTLKKNTIINYKVSDFYSKNYSKSIKFNDDNLMLNISKKISKKLILSENDKKGISFHDLIKNYRNKLK
tara:strand:+ start:2488 stop:3060 length:573 start_codon:yes stop_codon:yes gene_type:complete